jgi:hypothetical protein
MGRTFLGPVSGGARTKYFTASGMNGGADIVARFGKSSCFLEFSYPARVGYGWVVFFSRSAALSYWRLKTLIQNSVFDRDSKVNLQTLLQNVANCSGIESRRDDLRITMDRQKNNSCF